MNNILITNRAKIKILSIIKNSNYSFRIYISGGGCGGFLYNFKLDNFNSLEDIILFNNNFIIISDYISFNYIKNSTLDYRCNLISSFFYIKNPNIKFTCSCGKSFGI